MNERKIERLSKSKVEKGKYAVIKKGDCMKEQMKGYVARSLVHNEAHGIKSLRVGMLEIGPGEIVPKHNSAAEEIYYVLEGEGTIGVEGVNYGVSAGDIVYRAENIWHGPHVNTGGTTFRLLFVVSQPIRPATSGDVWFRGEKEIWKPKKLE